MKIISGESFGVSLSDFIEENDIKGMVKHHIATIVMQHKIC